MKDTNPNTLPLCILLARGDHVAGVLLDRIHHWSKHGTATIPDAEGHWVANDRHWWMREAQLSPKQYRSAAAKLVEFGLIEKRQYPFAGRNVVHMRPTALTGDILASAKTWDAALEILPHTDVPIPEWLTPKTQVGASIQEMIDAWGEESLTAAEIGKLVGYRQDLKHVIDPNGGKHDWSEDTLPLIVWAVNNWGKISTKEAPKPSVAFFCDNWGKVIIAIQQEANDAEFYPTPQTESAL